jgi:hypothetical protein
VFDVCECIDGVAVGNGTPGGGGCTEHEANECASCDAGHRLEDEDCLENVCSRANGNAVGSGSCTENGGDECTDCDEGYTLLSGSCEENTEEVVTDLCNNAVFDLTVIVDGSNSIPSSDFSTGLDFVQDLVDLLDISTAHTRFSLFQFSSSISIYGSLLSSPTDVTNAINSMRTDQLHQSTYTNYAIYYGWNNIRQNGRIIRNGYPEDVPQVVILMTDGEANHDAGLYLPLANGQYYYSPNLLHFRVDNVPIQTVYSIGIGPGVVTSELNTIATDPDSEHVFTASDFDDLETIYLAITSAVCADNSDNRMLSNPGTRMKDHSDSGMFEMFGSLEGLLDFDLFRDGEDNSEITNFEGYANSTTLPDANSTTITV